MPVEIREIVIKSTLHKKAPKREGELEWDIRMIQQLKEDILAICLEKLEEKLRSRKER